MTEGRQVPLPHPPLKLLKWGPLTFGRHVTNAGVNLNATDLGLSLALMPVTGVGSGPGRKVSTLERLVPQPKVHNGRLADGQASVAAVWPQGRADRVGTGQALGVFRVGEEV